jgi:hypothetical protein
LTSRHLAIVGPWVGAGLITIILAAAGYWLLFSTFMIYDDEGYILISLQNYSLHGGLYDKVYTQYGPIPYLWYDGWHRVLGFDFDNVTGRWITLVNWFVTAAACAALVGRATRSALWTAFTFIGTFTHVWVMTSEPIHPGGLICLVIAGVAFLAGETLRTKWISGFAVVTAIGTGLLVMTKINVGVFFLGGVVSWLALNTASASQARWLTWTVAVGSAVLPFILMRSLIDEPWVRQFALVFTAGNLGTLMAGRPSSERIVTPRIWSLFTAVFVGIIAAVTGLTLMGGTTFEALLNGVVLNPLKHPGVYFFPMRWSAGGVIVSLASLGFAAWTTQGVRKDSARVRLGIAWVRVLIVALFLCAPLKLVPVSMASWAMSYGVSVAWLFVFPLSKDGPVTLRCALALAFVFQTLHAYPIAGSQLNWATFLWIPLIALGLQDAGDLLRLSLVRIAPWPGRLAAVSILTASLFMTGALSHAGWNGYRHGLRLGLPGAESLRLSHDLAYSLRIANENLRAHADVLFSFPGLFSANIWTKLPTPTLSNVTHWFSLLTIAQQSEIIDQLAANPKAAVLVQRDLLDYLARTGFETKGPLHDWMAENFEKASAFGGYEIWVHRGRSIAAFSTARSEGTTRGVMETLTLTVPRLEAPVSRIDLCNIDQPDVPLITFGAENSSVTIEPCGLDGRPTGEINGVTFPFSSSGPALVTVRFGSMQVSGPLDRLLLVLRDVDNTVIRESLVVE